MLMRTKKEIKKSPKTNLWIISALSPDQQREWISEWCVKNKQTSINSDYVNDLSILSSFYRSRQNDCYGSNSPSNHFPQKMTISFMRLMLLLITTLKLLHSLSLLIRCEVPYRPKCLLNFGVVIKNNFSRFFERGYETATFSQKNVLFSANSHCTVYGTTQ
ncbi:hypothetical protein BM1374166_01779 [Bartonella tribocorum]|nr:hypothetical protein BM1374166_01779 [Bartonella tribocorum]